MTNTEIFAQLLAWAPAVLSVACTAITLRSASQAETWAINSRLAAVRAKKAANRAQGGAPALAPAVPGVEPVGESSGRHALTEEVMRTVSPRTHMSCPLDGEPLREMQLAEMQPALFTHVDGTEHPDRLTELTVRERHLEQWAMQSSASALAWSDARGAFTDLEMSVQRGGVQYASFADAFDSGEQAGDVVAENTEVIPRVPRADWPSGAQLLEIENGRGITQYQVVDKDDLVPEYLAGRLAEPLRAVDLPGLGRCEVVAETTEDRPALVRQVKDES